MIGLRDSCIRSRFATATSWPVEPNQVNQRPLHTPSPIVDLSSESGSEWGGGPSPWSERRGGSWHLRHTASGGGPGPEAGTLPPSPLTGGPCGWSGSPPAPWEKGQVTSRHFWVGGGTSDTSQGRMCAFLRAPAPLSGDPGVQAYGPFQQVGPSSWGGERKTWKRKEPKQNHRHKLAWGRAPGHAVPTRGLPACRALPAVAGALALCGRRDPRSSPLDPSSGG